MLRITLPYALAALLVLGCDGDRARHDPESAAAGSATEEKDLHGDPNDEPPPDSPSEMAPSSESPPPPGEIVFQVPMDVVVTISNSRRYGGTYRASGVGRVCGRNPYQLPGMENSWVVEFPAQGESPVRDLAVTAKQLASGTSTRQYDLSVRMLKNGGVLPSFVLRAEGGGRDGQTGTMSLQEEGYIARVKLEGRNVRGEQVDVSITCKRGESRP
jgi:hypothetical protein